jgi:hypothetical protein
MRVSGLARITVWFHAVPVFGSPSNWLFGGVPRNGWALSPAAGPTAGLVGQRYPHPILSAIDISGSLIFRTKATRDP